MPSTTSGAAPVDPGLAERQLRAIAEVVDLASGAGIAVWLRGGWAMDFFLGELTRPHGDVDWFCWAGDADRLARSLGAEGYVEERRVPPEWQRDLVRDGVELSFALLAGDLTAPVAGGAGPWAGKPYPRRMLVDAVDGRLGGITCPVIGAATQIELKELYPVWMPERPRRPKDREDIARLRAALPH